MIILCMQIYNIILNTKLPLRIISLLYTNLFALQFWYYKEKIWGLCEEVKLHSILVLLSCCLTVYPRHYWRDVLYWIWPLVFLHWPTGTGHHIDYAGVDQSSCAPCSVDPTSEQPLKIGIPQHSNTQLEKTNIKKVNTYTRSYIYINTYVHTFVCSFICT